MGTTQIAQTKQKNLEFILPLILVLLAFMVRLNFIGGIIYFIPAVLVALWFFPIRWFFHVEKNKSYITMLADVIVALLAISLGLNFLVADVVELHYVYYLFSTLNFGFLIYFYFQDNRQKRKWLHFWFLLLPPILF